MLGTRTALSKDVSHENREDHPVVQHLQRQVANALVLYTNYKHYHWQTFGPLFRDLHLMFDEFARDVLGTADEFAERVRMIGQDVRNVQLRQMQEAASVKSASIGQSMREMVEEADGNLLVVIKEMREAAKAADESNDPGTVDLFSRVVQIHEKQVSWVERVPWRDSWITSTIFTNECLMGHSTGGGLREEPKRLAKHWTNSVLKRDIAASESI